MAFYAAVFEGLEFQEIEENSVKYALFLTHDFFNNGALVQGEQYKPGGDGPLLYLDGGDDVNTVLAKVPSAGGRVIMNKTFKQFLAG